MFDRLSLIIGDERRGANDVQRCEEVINPADESVLGLLPHANTEDLEAVVSAAKAGFAVWRRSSGGERRAVLRGAADILRGRLEELTRVMTLEQGKPLRESAGEWQRVIETLEWHGDAAATLAARPSSASSPELVQFSLPEPVGVSLGLTAWNFPAVLPVRKVAPAIAAGCSMILKASEETPASAQALVEALIEAGLPAGVLNLVFGEPAMISATLISQPDVRKVSFTGSIPVGKLLAHQAAAGLKRCTFELGGHAPVIVFDDCDLEATARGLAGFKFRNAGQVCISPSRFFVHDSVYDEFRDLFPEEARKVVLGPGTTESTTMGPMANRRRVEAMARFKADAIGRGARIAYDGAPPPDTGFFVAPLVLEDVPEEALVMNEEIFGPIVPICRFHSEQEAISAANRLPYGLAAYAFTGDRERARRLAVEIEAGSVNLNTFAPAPADTPMGGVKESGYGYEGGLEGIEAYLVRKLLRAPAELWQEP